MADFLDEFMKDGAPEPQPEAPVEQPVESQEPQADPVAEPAPEPAPEPTPEPEAPKEDQRVPLATFLDKRDEARELKRRVEAYEAREREQQQARIDPFDDPEGFAASQQQMVEQRLTQERFAFSDRFARKEHGAEAVDAAVTWAQGRAQADPMFAASYMREADPVDWIVQQHKRDALLSEIGDPSKLDDWFAREAAKRGYVTPSAPVAAAPAAAVLTQPAARPAPPPRSIASDRSAAPTVTPEGERDGFLASIVGK